MRVLVLGGTVFLGRHVVDAALAGGHDVTVFSRGRSGSAPPDDVEWVKGDRDGELGRLGARSWDAVVDTSGYLPRVVAQSVALDCGHYTFVSSGNVYADLSVRGIAEDAPLASLPDDHGDDVSEHYGPLKAACEALLPAGALIVRSGLICGAHDSTGRFTYWAERVARGGVALAPGPVDQPMQLIDARDQAEWIIRCAETGVGGAFNVTGVRSTLGAVLSSIPGEAELRWVDGDWLLEQGVEPWSDLPLWLPLPELQGLADMNVDKAVAAGLTFRPVAETGSGGVRVPRGAADRRLRNRRAPGGHVAGPRGGTAGRGAWRLARP